MVRRRSLKSTPSIIFSIIHRVLSTTSNLNSCIKLLGRLFTTDKGPRNK